MALEKSMEIIKSYQVEDKLVDRIIALEAEVRRLKVEVKKYKDLFAAENTSVM